MGIAEKFYQTKPLKTLKIELVIEKVFVSLKVITRTLRCKFRRSSNVHAYLDSRMSPREYGCLCETGLFWKLRYALASAESRLKEQSQITSLNRKAR